MGEVAREKQAQSVAGAGGEARREVQRLCGLGDKHWRRQSGSPIHLRRLPLPSSPNAQQQLGPLQE
eukprot:4447276-Amphidinium_carterae.1